MASCSNHLEVLYHLVQPGINLQKLSSPVLGFSFHTPHGQCEAVRVILHLLLLKSLKTYLWSPVLPKVLMIKYVPLVKLLSEKEGSSYGYRDLSYGQKCFHLRGTSVV